ncbi:hypothetical protein Pst134EA_007567 [Puccinia striiformis f. sp. tritici]|uniref:hypothetical protein n=1 Tax=Puccinia striiformis f. sp. tritici TaxID=168172 RepID=UPI002007DB49|nr:hypothetical protein Pst134EA_007567 [Puccinia striiformis f. sp. tritici]KAH9470301.1 hypothetical protein Pst134EA_007567 [Puccinia striiformis f. sp. tritici]
MRVAHKAEVLRLHNRSACDDIYSPLDSSPSSVAYYLVRYRTSALKSISGSRTLELPAPSPSTSTYLQRGSFKTLTPANRRQDQSAYRLQQQQVTPDLVQGPAFVVYQSCFHPAPPGVYLISNGNIIGA